MPREIQKSQKTVSRRGFFKSLSPWGKAGLAAAGATVAYTAHRLATSERRTRVAFFAGKGTRKASEWARLQIPKEELQRFAELQPETLKAVEGKANSLALGENGIQEILKTVKIYSLSPEKKEEFRELSARGKTREEREKAREKLGIINWFDRLDADMQNDISGLSKFAE